MPSPIGDFFSNALRSLARPFMAAQSGITHKLATWGHDVALFGPLAQLGPGVSDKLDQASEKVLLPHSPLHVNVPEPKRFAPLLDNQPTELLRLLGILRALHQPPRFFHASSSEVFGRPETMPQDENTPFRPATPYGCAKAFATQMTVIYRQSQGLFACNGILYNHESPRRGENFVTQKICRAAAAIKQGRQRDLSLGSLTSLRDWGDAREYVQAMWRMLQQDQPGDYVLATGRQHSVEEVVETAFAAVGLNWREHVKQDPRFMRPEDPSRLVGNPAKAEKILGWHPSDNLKPLITEMTLAALD